MHYFLVFFVLILLLVGLGVGIHIGRIFGIQQLNKHPQRKLEVVTVAESAVFGLLALLVAFTFSGAYDRYEHRKMHLVEEAGIFEKVYNYIDITPENMQPELRKDVKEYFSLNIQAFNHIPYTDKVNDDLAKAAVLEEKIWKTVVAATDESFNKTLSQVYIPAFNDMFENAHMGYYLTQIHPPIIIFALLIGLAFLGAFLVGFTSAESNRKWPLHSVCYVLLTAVTIYVIINIEYPHIGFIDMGTFEQILVNVRDNMK